MHNFFDLFCLTFFQQVLEHFFTQTLSNKLRQEKHMIKPIAFFYYNPWYFYILFKFDNWITNSYPVVRISCIFLIFSRISLWIERICAKHIWNYLKAKIFLSAFWWPVKQFGKTYLIKTQRYFWYLLEFQPLKTLHKDNYPWLWKYSRNSS